MANSILNDSVYDTSLAIVGLAGRFPGAQNVDEFWQNLVNGVKSIRHFSDEELLANGVDPALLALPNYVKAGTILEGADLFDASFFKFSPREAEVMDPQHRLFLECAYQALEDAAYDPERYKGLVGVFAGSAISTYLLNNLAANTDFLDEVGRVQVSISNDRDSLANTLSYKLNLRGPSFAVQTFCSTSLVAIHLACQSLLNYECDIALAGGVAVELPQIRGYLYEEGGILSPDGECRTFDQNGRGSVMGNGLGVVVVKRLADALEDGDQIYALVRGSHTNNDGSVRASYTAPGLDGQAAVISQAISNAGVDPETLTYMEAHGTATMLGDAVELAAMKKAFALHTQKQRYCALGSVKPNVGHLDRASGVTGLIKTTLALKNKLLPPSLNFEQAGPDAQLEQSPFYVNTSLKPWETEEGPRRAGVSSFGLGGSNAHVVLEEAPELPETSASRPHQLLLLSAKSESALAQATENLYTYLAQHPETRLADIAYTLQNGRTAFNYRRTLVCTSHEDAMTALKQEPQRLASTYQVHRDRPVTLLLSDVAGVTEQQVLELRAQEKTFDETITRCLSYLQTAQGISLPAGLFEASSQESPINKVVANFVYVYAVAHLFTSWGVPTQALAGVGSSEYAVASLAGVLELEVALQAVIAYAHQHTEDGRHTAQAVPLQAATKAYFSFAEDAWIQSGQTPPDGYGKHILEPSHAVASSGEQLFTNQPQVVFAIGSDNAYTQQIQRQLAAQSSENKPIFIRTPELSSLQASFLQAFGQLWLAGVTLQWDQLTRDEVRRRVSLPTYPFERQRYWIEQSDVIAEVVSQSARKPDIADWFYRLTWEEAPLTVSDTTRAQSPAPWLIFSDTFSIGQAVSAYLQDQGQTAIQVQAGTEFIQLDPQNFRIRPHEAEDYIQLCQALQLQESMPTTVLHLWNITAEVLEPEQSAAFEQMQDRGFYSLIFLTQALSKLVYERPVQMLTISNHLQAVTSEDHVQPEKATLIGACRVIAQENLNIRCRSIDLDVTMADKQLVEQLVHEATSSDPDTFLAYRNGTRLKQHYQPYRLDALPQKQVFRKHGVYLITGGMGGVGPLLGAYLAQQVQAKVILTSRSEFLPADQWKTWLEGHDALDATSLKIKQLQAIEAAGGEVLVLKADVSNVEQMRAAIQHSQQRFGALHGVLHAAGVTDPRAFKATLEIGRQECETHFQPKVYGLYALEEVLQDQELDFCLLFSSISVVLGGLAFSAYVAGNAFMDAFAHKHNMTTDQPWLCVNWDTWQVKENAHGALGATVADYVMSPPEGAEALTRVLAHGHTHLVNSTGDLQARIQQWVQLESLQADEADDQDRSTIKQQAQRFTSVAEYERVISEIWKQVLGVSEIGLYDNFFDLGGNSLIALQVIAKLKKTLHIQIPAVALFEAPTISTLVHYLLPDGDVQRPVAATDLLIERRSQARQNIEQQDIAIVSMAGRFPGASNVNEFWENLRNGVESITFFSDEELKAAGIDPKIMADPAFVRARPVLKPEEVKDFDAAFFGYSPREAELTDPQHRLFIECAWEALELAGYDPTRYPGLIGVYGGANISTYLFGLMANPADVGPVDDYQMVIGNDKDSLTTSVSYKLNLKGPSFAVQTFCSTSLVATHLACQSLIHGECDLALAGGVSVRVPTVAGHIYQEGGMESPDGHCRTFDAQAKGSMFGDGVGIVVLKRLQDALDDGDQVMAVIKGSAINNDGALKVSYTAPSVVGQADVVATALRTSGIHPETISYIEAHGTATELGDPIEVASLTKAYQAFTDRTNYCAIGSVKTNIGHLDRAAGISGLMKTVLSLQHKEIPASLHYQAPNPEIDFDHSPFYVNAKLSPWLSENGMPRRAGINSLGLGGTNAHIIVEEAPELAPSSPSRDWQLLVLSARTAKGLEQVTQNLSTFLQEHPTANLADVAYTLNVGRKKFEHRRVIVAQNQQDVISTIESKKSPYMHARIEQRTDQHISFLFPGLGEQHIGMAQNLYRHEAAFREVIDSCCELLQNQYQLDLKSVFGITQSEQQSQNGHSNGNGNGNGKADTASRTAFMLGSRSMDQSPEAERLRHTDMSQPAIFIFEYALARLLMQWGIQPRSMLGYSLGEYVAACLAGVFTLEDGLKLVVERARLIEASENGTMVAVMLSEEKVKAYLTHDINLAIINAPDTCVLAGPTSAMETLITHLEEAEIAHQRVETTHAFHSEMLKPLAAQLTELVHSIHLHAPQIPYISNVSGTWITAEQATDPAYWAQHMCQTVRFSEGVGQLLRETEQLFLEVGLGQALTSFVRQHPDCAPERNSLVFATQPSFFEKQPEHSYLLTVLGKLWLSGVEIDLPGFYQGEKRKRIALPTYPFEKQSYWIETRPWTQAQKQVQQDRLTYASPEEFLSNLKKEALSDWFYLPGWKQSAPLAPVAAPETEKKPVWWLFMDHYGIGEDIKAWLTEQNYEVISIEEGSSYAQLDDATFSVRPSQRADYEQLVKDLRQVEKLPQRIVHLWTLTTPDWFQQHQATLLEDCLDGGFYSLLALSQALGNVELAEPCQIITVSNETQDVTGSEPLCAEKTTLTGPLKVIPQEYPGLSCRGIDIQLTPTSHRQEVAMTQQLLGELTATTTERVVALRKHRRWLQTFEPLHLPAPSTPGAQLREHGVYLITGGLGGVGLAMAKHLARSIQARLILLSRTALPARDQWERILKEQGDTQGVGQQIRKVLDLEQLGAQVLVIPADVANEQQMRAAIELTLQTYGELHGVLHAAGVPGIGLIQHKTPAMAASVMAPKIQGTLVLEKVLQSCQLDFLVLFSSITSITGGGPGQVDYCAANAFMDAYAATASEQHGMTIAINWSEWQWNAWEAGLAGYDTSSQAFFRENRRRFGIAFEEGAEVLERLLAAPWPQVVVSTQDFQALVELSKAYTAASMLEKSRQARVKHERPALGSEYSAPHSEMEHQLAAIWEDILGIDHVGINDNFFELGGNSLIGIDIITRMRKELAQEDIPSYLLYEAPSVAAMAQQLDKGKSTEMVTGRYARGERRRANLKQRMQGPGRQR
ncbi:hypothetical protein KDA_67710 [Dictyobacter alpinus]|uniref:Polyketide synthase n=1 Tax=Dictyobacter alpinus TaxID=2014873 RepID=A0A402BJ37_9CHLR|nr:type I polyketide synthase [Dictyobacter alpinus]GCE31287.1 hypothetical protein KDA_67710 [Dictyobacter alpinus]